MNAQTVLNEVVLPQLEQNTTDINAIAKELITVDKNRDQKMSEVIDLVNQNEANLQQVQDSFNGLYNQVVTELTTKINEADRILSKEKNEEDFVANIKSVLDGMDEKIKLLENEEVFEYDDKEIKNNISELKSTFDLLKTKVNKIKNVTSEDLLKEINSKDEIIEITSIKGLLAALNNVSDKASSVKVAGSILEILNAGSNVAQGATRLNFTGGTVTYANGVVTIPLSGGSPLLLKVNGTNNGSQTLLNLKQGTNVTIVDDGVGGVTINSTGGGAAAWGSITGTLSSQTDLQTALNAKQNSLTLTTTGTSGAATLVGSTLNIPQYTGGGGGTPGGATTQLQYNDAGAFNGDSTLTFDKSTKAFVTNGISHLPFLSGAWIDLPTTGPSGIGNGGAGANAWVAYVKSSGQWFTTGSVAGDIAYRNTGGSLRFGTSSGTPSLSIVNDFIGVRDVTSPTAYLHIGAGTAAAGTAPIKLNAGTVMTTPEAGTFEFTNSETGLTFTSVSTRRQVVLDTVPQTISGKRITKRTGTTTSSATPTINTDNVDFYSLTAQAVDITSFTTNLSGTPTEGQTLWIAITGTAARAITWGASFESSTQTLPTTTVSTNRLDVGFVWNTATSKWRCVAVA